MTAKKTAKKKAEQRGIWCLETVWFEPESNASMRPMLELVNALYGTPYVHRNAVSREEFLYFLEAWAQAGRDKEDEEKYPVLVLSYHGLQGTISLKEDPDIDWADEDSWAGSDSLVTLDEIRDALAGRCRDRIVHFSSCSSLDVAHADINDFLDTTGVSAVSGYTKDVPWTQALALDLLYLEAIQKANFFKLTPVRMSEVYDQFRWTSEDLSSLPENDGYLPTAEMVKRLGFNMRVRNVPAG